VLYHGSRRLCECGFWNVLADVLSNEAYDLIYSTIGCASLFRNANAFDAIWALLREFAEQEYYKIPDGYQRLPQEMLERAKDVVAIHDHHRLKRIGRQDGSFALHFNLQEGDKTELADRVILALPRRALQLIDFDDVLFEDVDAFMRYRDDAVTSERACKLFLTFKGPWWDQSVFGPKLLDQKEVAKVSAAYTDLPMRQCYYYGTPKANTPALLLASYADDAAVSFWCALTDAPGGIYANLAKDPEDQLALLASEDMVASARRQLSAMHHDVKVPRPTGAYFFDWGKDPYGAGWHAWAPGVRSWQVGPIMRQPNPELCLFICGEAYSQTQGWVEGAINSAEMLLRRLDVDPPPWMEGVDYEFEMEGDHSMENNLTHLLVALSSSLELQRAFARDREAIMKAFGLDEAEKAALRANDEAAITKLTSNGVVIQHYILRYSTKC
jgi:monoamine oxidase